MSNETGKEATHVFLDVSQVFQIGKDAIALASQRFIETGSVAVDVDLDADRVAVDMSRMILSALAIINPLLTITSQNWALSVDDTVQQLRELIDEKPSATTTEVGTLN